MVRRLMTILPLLLALSAGTVWAQGRFAIELNAGVAFPTEDLGTAALKTGGGVGFTGNMRVMPHLHLYGGWDYVRFTAKESVLGAADIDDTGYAFGAKFQHPMFNRVDGWLRAGALYNHIELEDDAGDVIVDSGHEFGWEAGAGLFVPLTDRFAVMPGARFRSYSATLAAGTTELPVDLRYMTAELRLAWTFGAVPMVAARR